MGSEEKVFFEKNHVLVTNARFVSTGETFAMANISSVKAASKSPPIALPLVLIVLGLLIAVNHGAAWLILAVGGGFILWAGKARYYVMVNTNAGEVKAFETTDKNLADEVISAVNEAMIHRG